MSYSIGCVHQRGLVGALACPHRVVWRHLVPPSKAVMNLQRATAPPAAARQSPSGRSRMGRAQAAHGWVLGWMLLCWVVAQVHALLQGAPSAVGEWFGSGQSAHVRGSARALGEGGVAGNRVGWWPSRSHVGLELCRVAHPKWRTCCAVGRSSGLSLRHSSMRSQISCKAQQCG